MLGMGSSIRLAKGPRMLCDGLTRAMRLWGNDNASSRRCRVSIRLTHWHLRPIESRAGALRPCGSLSKSDTQRNACEGPMATNVAPSSSATADSIPGFGGIVFAPDTPGYDEKRRQYASSSYPEKQAPEGSMRPYLIAYPRPDTDDIAAAISFAKSIGK